MNECYESYEHAQLRMIEDFVTWLNSFDSVDSLIEDLYSNPTSGKADLIEYVGNIDIPMYLPERKQILRAALKSKSLWIRYGAIAGLSYLDDSSMLLAVEEMLQTETNNQLKKYAHRVLKYWYQEKDKEQS